MKRLRCFRRYGPGSILVISLLAAGSGFLLRDLPGRLPQAAAHSSLPDLDLYVQPRSFSEIEVTRAELTGLALRFRTEARMKQLERTGQQPPGAAQRQAAIAELERGIAEFKDTPEELYLVSDLLLLLRADGQSDRWLDVYLEVLYRRPTQEVLAALVPAARRMAQQARRDAEVEVAINHVLTIPLDFPAKRLLQEYSAHVALSTSPPRSVL